MKQVRLWFALLATLTGVGWLTPRCQAQPWAPDYEPPTKIKWLTDYDAALKQAQSSNQLVVVDFFTTWCGPCKYMDMTTFADAKVQARLAGFVPLKIDGDKHPELIAKYGPPGWPTMLVTDATGKPIIGTAGYVDPANYLAVLDMAVTKYAASKNNATNAVPPAPVP